MSERSNSKDANQIRPDETAPTAGLEDAFDHLTLENRLESAGILVDENASTPGLALDDALIDLGGPSSGGNTSVQSQRERLAQWQEDFSQGLPQNAPLATANSSEHAANHVGTAFAPPTRTGKSKGWLLVFLAGVLGIWALQSRPAEDATVDAVEEPVNDAPAAELYEPNLAAPPFAPECWRRDEGFQFRYKDASDALRTVDRVTQIPTLYRRNAKCIPATAQGNNSKP